jgi:hypothetical protein
MISASTMNFHPARSAFLFIVLYSVTLHDLESCYGQLPTVAL